MDQLRLPRWLVFLLAFVFLLRIPSLFEPHYYGDEMIYIVLGQAVRKGLVLYKDVHDNKPPLLYLLAAVAGNVFWFRAILSFAFVATTALFWKLCTVLFSKNEKLPPLATILFGVFGSIPLTEGQIANAELFMIGFSIAGLLILLATKKTTPKRAFISGVLFSFASLLKIPAAFDMLVVLMLFALSLKLTKDSIRIFSRKAVPFAGGFFIPIIISIIWYYLRGAGKEYIIAAYLENVGYLSSFRPNDVAQPFLVKNGPLLIRGVILLISYALLWTYRKKLTKPFILASAWLFAALFAITLSERPYPHYVIQALPALAILFAMLVYEKTLSQVYVIIPLLVFFAAPVYYKFWYYQSFPYYQNFTQFVSGDKTKREYFSYFDQNTSRNYAIAKDIRMLTKEDDFVFVWYDGAPIYALSNRLPPTKYIAGYHINDFDTPDNTIMKLSKNFPSAIVVLPNSPDFPALNKFLKENYLEYTNRDGAIIWKRSYTPRLGLPL